MTCKQPFTQNCVGNIDQSLSSSVLSRSQKRRKNRLAKKLRKSASKKGIVASESSNSSLERTNASQSTSTTIISSVETRNRNDSITDGSDCEIIEQVTPVIVLDDDCLTETTHPDAENETIKNTSNSSSDTVITVPNQTVNENDSSTSNELNVPTEEEHTTKPTEVLIQVKTTSTATTQSNSNSPEDIPWFFVDKTPGNNTEAPIYEINCPPSTSNNPNMAKNIRITIQNKENDVNIDNSFAPNPLLSSTRLNETIDETEESAEKASNDAVAAPSNFCISINSTGVDDKSRRVSVGKSASKPINFQMANANRNNAQNGNKRKASNENATEGDEPSSKRRSHNRSSDVIVLNDTMSGEDENEDEDDSVVFVSETMDHQNQNRINLLRRQNDFISVYNASSNRKSSRAKRKQERKKAERERALKAALSKNLKPNKINRFTPSNNNSNNNDKMATKSSTKPSSPSKSEKAAAKKKISLEYEKEKKLFAEKPELFEKREIIIDGSNVAYSHGEAVGKSGLYSVKGLELCMKHFEDQGFNVKIVIPLSRLKPNRSSDMAALLRIEKAGKLIKSPCKNLPGLRSSSYDDRFVLQSAELKNGAIISNDNYADLLNEKEEWDEIIKQRVIGFSWCDDCLMIPIDPYGRHGRSSTMILHKLKDDVNIDDINGETKTK